MNTNKTTDKTNQTPHQKQPSDKTQASGQWMIYGANGFTGKLIAEEAARRGLTPVLAGRTLSKIRPLAEKLGLEFRIFDPSELANDKTALEGISLLLLCAGPFSQTSLPFVNACLQQGIHYLDITGEIPVLEAVLNRSAEAKTKGSVLIPGVGFDVVPSDCLAALLAKKLPGATHLELAFAGSATLSPGTTKTMIEMMPEGGKIRENGKIRAVPSAYHSRKVKFPFGELSVTTIPWGDVCSAFYSTGIPNIRVYVPMGKAMVWLRKPIGWLAPVLAQKTTQNFLKSMVDKFVHGPSPEAQKKAKMFLWGRVSKGEQSVEGWLTIPEGYYFTMLAALKCVEQVQSGKVPPGSYTPSLAFGAEFIQSFPEAEIKI